jgi:hypothetical protein
MVASAGVPRVALGRSPESIRPLPEPGTYALSDC